MEFTVLCYPGRFLPWKQPFLPKAEMARQLKNIVSSPKQLLRIMKLTAIILLSACLHVAAAGRAQNVTLSLKDVTIPKVFQEVGLQGGVTIIYDEDYFKETKLVSINVKEALPIDVIKQCLLGLPFTVSQEGLSIAITADENLSPRLIMPELTVPPVTGIIRNADGNPLVAVNIVVKGTKRGTVTDASGRFSIEAKVNDILIISSIGYNTKEVKITSTDILPLIVLEQNLSPLDEVQVVAYGTTTRRLNTGNVSTVKAADIEKSPVNNPLLALQGRVPGVLIEQGSGVAGSGVKVRIQGQNSIGNGNVPFYVIDGVPYLFQSNQGSAILNPTGGGVAGSPLNFINPNNIESIEILKDADATAIYGSRAANGAILITTKKGSLGKTKMDVNVQKGVSHVARKLPMMNTQQYLAMRKEAIENDGLAIPNSPTPEYYDLTLYDQNRYTDWQKELIGKTAGYLDAQANISGGTNQFSGLFGVNYHKETNVFPGNFADQRIGVVLNLNASSNNGKFRFQHKSNYLFDDNRLPGRDLTNDALTIIPNAPALYNEDGSLNWALYQGRPTWINPVAEMARKFYMKTTNLVSSSFLSYTVLPGLQLKANLGYNKVFSDVYSNFPQDPIFGPGFPVNLRSATFNKGNLSTLSFEPQINYINKSRLGSFDFLLGATFSQTKNNVFDIWATGFNDDTQLEDLSAATTKTATEDMLQYNYGAIFGRAGYNYGDRYLANITIRRDGSSRFGPENLFNTFYSIAGAWVFSEEAFFKNKQSLLGYGKIKLSYGTTGNDQIGDYKFMELYDPTPYDISYGGGYGLAPSGHSNPILQWEETKKINVGLNLGFRNDLIMVELNYYRNRTSNQLVNQILPIITGFSGIAKNFTDAKVQNSGVELSIVSTNIASKNFKWTTNFNLTIGRNKLLEYKNLEFSANRYSLVVGKPLNIQKVYNFIGVNPQTGVYEAMKADGSKTSSPNSNTDMTIVIENDPKFFCGLSNTFSYKSFQFDILLQYVNKVGIDPVKFGLQVTPGLFSSSGASGNQPVWVFNNWKKEGDVRDIQRFTSLGLSQAQDIFYPISLSSNQSYVNASYLRIKNLSVSWQFPQRWTNEIGIQNCKLFFQGQNIFTITPYKGLDPEVASSLVTVPPLRTLVFGIYLTL